LAWLGFLQQWRAYGRQLPLAEQPGQHTKYHRNGPFTFATQEALNDQYQISLFHAASTQSQGCTLWNYKGVVTASVNTAVVDCGHNDWTWIDGTKTAGRLAHRSTARSQQLHLPRFRTLSPTPWSAIRRSWVDRQKWQPLAVRWRRLGTDRRHPQDTLNAPMNDLWVCVNLGDYCQWQLQGAYDPTVVNTVPPTTVGAQIIANAQHEGQGGVYGTPGLRQQDLERPPGPTLPEIFGFSEAPMVATIETIFGSSMQAP